MEWDSKLLINDLIKKLRQYKTVRINGIKFVIKKINPLLDFAPEKMPQIFTDFQSQRPVDPDQKSKPDSLRKNLESMGEMIEAGLVKPEIGKDVELQDILTDTIVAFKLYTEILIHSLNMFRGLKGVFFCTRLRHHIYTTWRRNLVKARWR